jgi:DNA repair exonuclease SbcCD nuclease subunit
LKVVHFSDFHAHIFQEFAKADPEFVNDRFRAHIDTLKKVYEIARENNAILTFGGDLFHNRSRLEDVVFNAVYDVIADNSDIPTYLLRGNHDSKNNTTDSEHWLKTFRHLPHVTVIDKPEIKHVAHDGDNLLLCGIPYSDDVAYLKEKIDEFAQEVVRGDAPSILMAHVGVDGSETGRHSHRLEGAFSVDDLKPTVFTYVPLGHYHKRQFLGDRNNIFYTGNTIQTSFSDEGQEKGVMLMDTTAADEPEFIAIDNKQFITITEIDEETQDLVENHYVRFVLPQNLAQEVEVFKEASDNFRVEVQREYKVESRIGVDMDSTEEDIVKAYAEQHYPESMELAIDILQEAKQVVTKG